MNITMVMTLIATMATLTVNTHSDDMVKMAENQSMMVERIQLMKLILQMLWTILDKKRQD